MRKFNLAKLIRTDSGKLFVYDGLTNKLISIDCGAAARKKKLSELSKEIFPELLRRNLLQNKRRNPARWQASFEEYKNFLDDRIPILTLQITRNCNLACSYCVYSGKYPHVRPAANDDMSPEIIRRSIEFYAAHSSKVPVRNISFYGGEALLRFREIKKAVAYADNVFNGKPFEISVSTNGTLLDKNVFDWMRENPNVKIHITLNGAFQDRYRKNPSGEGSLETVMTNLTLLRESYPELWGNQTFFISNYVKLTEVPAILKFYEQFVIPKNPIFFTGILHDLANKEIQQLLKTDIRKKSLVRKALRQEFYRNPSGLIKNFFQSDLEILDKREIFDADDEMKIASCMPFTAKIFVRTDGKFNMCERTSDTLILGDLDIGFNEQALAKILSEAEQLINRNCRDCWAQRICFTCFQNMTDENGKIREKFPTDICRNMRRKLHELLKIYCEVYS